MQIAEMNSGGHAYNCAWLGQRSEFLERRETTTQAG